jgi:hypothetical protein
MIAASYDNWQWHVDGTDVVGEWFSENGSRSVAIACICHPLQLLEAVTAAAAAAAVTELRCNDCATCSAVLMPIN